MSLIFFTTVIINAFTFFFIRFLALRKTEGKAFWKGAKKTKTYFLFTLILGIILCFFFLENVFPLMRTILVWIYEILFWGIFCFFIIYSLRERKRIQGAVKRRLMREKQ
jgi:Ca2+/Na+ antiporter